MYKSSMPRRPYPIDLSPLLPDLTQRRACLMVIDDQAEFLEEDELDSMSHYRQAMPKFITLADNYMDIIHVACTNSPTLRENLQNPDYVERDLLRIPDAMTLLEQENILPVDFLHGFDPRSDFYHPKKINDALNSYSLQDFLRHKNYGTICLAGVRLGGCLLDTHDGLKDFKNKFQPNLRIAAIYDLTEYESLVEELGWRNISPKKLKENMHIIFGEETFLATAQDILSIWNHTYNIHLDIDLPTIVNQSMIRKTLRV